LSFESLGLHRYSGKLLVQQQQTGTTSCQTGWWQTTLTCTMVSN